MTRHVFRRRMAIREQPRYALPVFAQVRGPVMTGPAAEGGGRLRAGHADREWVLEALKDAFVDGRLARAAARSGGCLIIAVAAVRLGALTDPDPTGGTAPYYFLGPLCFLVAFFAVMTA